jgi:hypothetical protein
VPQAAGDFIVIAHGQHEPMIRGASLAGMRLRPHTPPLPWAHVPTIRFD